MASQSGITQFIPGVDGEDGDEGPPGPPGMSGVDGVNGVNGVPIPGRDGDDGQAGPPGAQGPAGATGANGVSIPGQDGEDALVGFTGFPTKVLDSSVSGVLPVGNGGTGLSTFTANRVPYASATDTIGTSANFVFDGSTVTASAITSSGTLTGQGLVDISGASAGQIKFPATQNASANANTLDDYEEGTWTPVLTLATPGDLNVVYSIQTGTYTKVGRLVAATFSVVTSTYTFTTGSGNVQITGAPFTSLTLSNHNWRAACTFSGVTKATYTQINIRLASNASTTLFTASGSAVAASTVTAADTPSGGSVSLASTMVYETA